MQTDKLISYLSNNDVKEKELRVIYNSFRGAALSEGFELGARNQRKIYQHARRFHRKKFEEKFNNFLSVIEKLSDNYKLPTD